MEIIFDENRNFTFQGEDFPVYKLDTIRNSGFKTLMEEAHCLLRQHAGDHTVIICPTVENGNTYLFASILGIEGRSPDTLPMRAVFKVKDYKASLEKYRPYFSFTSAADYILRLLDMKRAEMYKDIQSLSYLGLQIHTDYLQNTITLRLPSEGKPYVFYASTLENSVILASFIKMLSLMKIKTEMDVTIVLKMLPEDNLIRINRNRLLQKLYWCAKPFLPQQ